jgi:hypothetical protein
MSTRQSRGEALDSEREFHGYMEGVEALVGEA